MGLIIHEEKKFNIGITASDFVITVRGSVNRIEKCADGYLLQYNIYYYLNMDAYQISGWGSEPIQSEQCSILLSAEQLQSNIFSHIYAQIAEKYQSTTSC